MPRSTTSGRVVRLSVVAALLMASGSAVTATGTEAPAKRPPRHSQPAHTSQSAPDVTGTIAKSPSRQSSATPSTATPGSATQGSPAQDATAPDAPAPPPFYLPTVARPLMHACGEKWRAAKMAGTTGDDDWRDFAVKCLASTDDPTSRNR